MSFGGRGEFDGVMTGLFRRPRVEGNFKGENIRAWDTTWGDGTAHIVVENSYVKIADSYKDAVEPLLKIVPPAAAVKKAPKKDKKDKSSKP